MMDSIDQSHAESLRVALNSLYHSGPQGFEGLLGILLGQLTGQTFRLASSGSQRGRDGDSAFDGGATYFEGKRYNSSPSKAEIAAKLYDLSADDAGQVDLWILGATCEVAALTMQDATRFTTVHGIGIVKLDWSNNDLGSLLVAIAAAPRQSRDFIGEGLGKGADGHLLPAALAAIDHFAGHSDLPTRRATLLQALSAEDVGLGHAKSLNRTWMLKHFSTRALARAEFGQPLSPLDATRMTAVSRSQQAALLGAVEGKPSAGIYAVIGDEGVGKSWLCAITWLQATNPSLLVVCPADELLSIDATTNFERFLLEKLIRQTGWNTSERTVQRWRRRLRAWRANPSPDNIRLTLIVDGINQPRKSDWARWLDRAALEMQSLGGSLIVSTRTMHWSEIARSLTVKVTPIHVERWTVAEVRSLLTTTGIDALKVSDAVLETLRNPRLFGIALDLLHANEVEELGHLTVGRLMFEHMRKAQETGTVPMSGPEFANFLKRLGNDVIERLKRQDTDDIRLFDASKTAELQYVATCRFFEPVPGESLGYEIKSEGLNLALALYLISALEAEARNGRNPVDRLANILEPIAALDEAASVVFLATQVACLQENSQAVRAALIEHFTTLQNPPNDQIEVFSLLARSATSSFLAAAESVYTSNAHHANADWLFEALIANRHIPDVWSKIEESAKRWLSVYSLAPERMMFRRSGRDTVEEVTQEKEKRSAELGKAVTELTPAERAYLEANLTETTAWNFDSLLKVVFYLLAGKPLKNFAPYFVRFAFSDALGPAIHASDKEFRQLVSFNRVDWAETRAALLLELMPFAPSTTSRVGKWARVEVLRATGALDDAREAEDMAEWLTRDREKFAGWSRVEDYCAADPCDPDSPRPDNVAETAKEYRTLDVATLVTSMGPGEHDHFFNDARPGVTRFQFEDSVHAHRALADDVLGRVDLPRRQGVIALRRHSAVLNEVQVESFLRSGQESTVSYKNAGRSDKDQWLTAQYSILISIPHLTASDQLEALANIQGETVLLETLNSVLPAAEADSERTLQRVLKEGVPNAQATVLAAVHHAGSKLSSGAIHVVSSLIGSENAIVRAQALGVAAATGEPATLKLVADSGWDARNLAAPGDAYERWYGSSAILEAARAGYLTAEDALDRMHLDHYGFAAQELGHAAALLVVPRIDAALRSALGYAATSSLPDMETTIPALADTGPPLVSLSEPPPIDQKARFDQLRETAEQFDDRQERARDSYSQFVKTLTLSNAHLILSDLTLDGLKALAAADPKGVERWLAMLLEADDAHVRYLHHLALQIAVVMKEREVPDADLLLRRVLSTTPTMRRVSGAAKVNDEALLLWNSADVAAIGTICRQRLKTRRNDADIAVEVLAAYLHGKGEVVDQVIDELLATGQPADTCHALTLAGYSDEGDHVSSVIASFEGAPGWFIGKAQQEAKAAYERNKWSKAWYRQMLAANSPLEFWQPSVLLEKIVDGRFDVWQGNLGAESETFAAFEQTVYPAVRNRIEKWQKKRKNNLYGNTAPVDNFLPE